MHLFSLRLGQNQLTHFSSTLNYAGDAMYDKPDGFDQRWLDQQDQGNLITNSQILREAADWQEYSDDATGAIYYYNKKTGETVWDAPRYFDHIWLLDA